MKKDLMDVHEIQGGYYKEDLVPVKIAFFIAGLILGFIVGIVAIITYLT